MDVKKQKVDTTNNLLWYELVHAKYWEQYLSQYCSRKLDYRKLLSLSIIVLSSIGASSWLGWDVLKSHMPHIVGYGLIIVVILQLTVSILDMYATTPQETQDIIFLRVKYLNYFNELEKLYQDYYNYTISDEEARSIFFSIRKEHISRIETIKENLNIKKLNKPNKKAYNNAIQYLETRYKIAS